MLFLGLIVPVVMSLRGRDVLYIYIYGYITYMYIYVLAHTLISQSNSRSLHLYIVFNIYVPVGNVDISL